jgi:sulfate-transporting ATPase
VTGRDWPCLTVPDRGSSGRDRYEELLNTPAREALAHSAAIYIPPGPRLGEQVIEASALRKGFGDRLLIDDLSFSLPPGGIVGVIGPNGAGKTTLIKMLKGEEAPDGGELTLGQSVKMVSIDQTREGLSDTNTVRRASPPQARRKPAASPPQARRKPAASPPPARRQPAASPPQARPRRQTPPGPCRPSQVFEEMTGGTDEIELGTATVSSRAYTSWFGFKGGDQQKQVVKLSGGERNRVQLGKLLRAGGNVLLMDEPTNDLDVDTMRSLEDAILEYAGCVVTVSHDRYFLDRLCTHILAAEGEGKWTWFEGNFQEYEADRIKRQGDAPPKPIKYATLA